ncbi:porin [Dyadobacter pollutisoli]|uniref:Porin n=1 Tax=Dyadobacter pollutisoli TaxID=2910158 RepID=A0A9E8NCT4_9BACT|nr:porin [Dyadobacter pollutisoli]WAC14270.1 porin [Dyadobacter pollutisoli]
MKFRFTGLLFLFILLTTTQATAQKFLMDLVDTTNQMGKGMLSIYERYNRVRISGYIQPQFQVISKEGAESYNGGNFPALSNNRFMLRRGRLRVDYAHLNEHNDPTSYFVFQFDGTERGVAIRDFWGRFYENKSKIFALTTGMFARPFGHEVNLSSANRETPERGRMSQILMKTERDIGVMLTVTSRKNVEWIQKLKFDLGVFNGQGMSGPTDYDSHKDVIGRFSLKPTQIKALGGATLSAAISGYVGGITSQSNVIYTTRLKGTEYIALRDSSSNNYKKATPRNYAGADFQLSFPNTKGETEFRAEYVAGKQTATFASSETPGVYPVTNGLKDPLYTRSFNGAYFYFIQNLGSIEHQLALKYDWYDANAKVSGKQLSAANGFNKADLRYDTFGMGYIYIPNESLKLMFYYEIVRNEKSALPGFETDAPDNVLTCRVQYNF